MNILSIQSTVALGHVGNSAAVLPLQRLGFEVWPIATAMLAHHPGHGTWRGRVSTPGEIATMLDGIDARGGFVACDAVLSGYLADRSLGVHLLDAVRRIRTANPSGVYCCDPVMGDAEKGFFVHPDIPAFFRDEALPAADILVPNTFELAYLTGRPVDGPESAYAAARLLLTRGPRLVVVTGVERETRGRRQIGALAVEHRRALYAEAPWIEAPASGAGDLFAALFLGHYLKSRRLTKALSYAVSGVHGVMVATKATRSDELALVAAQDAFTKPKRLFKASKMR